MMSNTRSFLVICTSIVLVTFFSRYNIALLTTIAKIINDVSQGSITGYIVGSIRTIMLSGKLFLSYMRDFKAVWQLFVIVDVVRNNLYIILVTLFLFIVAVAYINAQWKRFSKSISKSIDEYMYLSIDYLII